jgi:mannose-6-phosphate isomerase-like protein (cupin superfamily)
MYVIDRPAKSVDDIPGITHRTLAGQAEGLRRLSVWQQTMAPGAATPPHRHRCEEVVLVTRGEGEVHIGGAAYCFRAGQTLVLPPDVDHQIFNTGSGPLDTTAVFAATPVPVELPDGSPLALPWRS